MAAFRFARHSGLCAKGPSMSPSALHFPHRYAYVGTFTQDAPGGTAGGPSAEGIYVFAVDDADAVWTPVQVVASENPSFLALHPKRPYLYAANEIDTYLGMQTGTVEAYSIDATTGMLTLLNRQPLSLSQSGAAPAHLGVTPDGKYVVVALYGGGAYALLPIGLDGRLDSVSDLHIVSGKGVHTTRQEAPHPHMVAFDAEGGFVLATDLGTDRLNVFKIEQDKLHLHHQASAEPGAGPRHVAFDPSHARIFVTNELTGTLAVYGYDPATGTVLARDHVVDAPPVEKPNEPDASAVIVHPSGQYLYASHRAQKATDDPASESVSVWAIDDATGALTLVQRWTEGVVFPRALTLSHDGRFLYVLNQKNDDILRLTIAADGTLSDLLRVAAVPTPVCLVLTPRTDTDQDASDTPGAQTS